MYWRQRYPRDQDQSIKDSDSPSDFQVPLYHGTSTIFLNGILEHGLGGWNPIQERRA
jgi:hypothetical protein